MAKTNQRTETKSFMLFRYTDTKRSEQAVDIDIPPDIICFARNIALGSIGRIICDCTTVKVVLNIIGVMHLVVPWARTCKL